MHNKRIIITTILFLGLAIANGYFFDYLNKTYYHLSSEENGMADFPLPVKFILIILLIPFIETIFFQVIPNQVLKVFKVDKQIYFLLIPTLFFSMVHFYNVLYICMAFCGGLILNYYYLETQKISKHSFLLTVLFHAFYNLWGFLFVS